MESFADQLVGDVGTVEIAGVDMIDTARHGFTQHGERRLVILGWPKHSRSGQLHGAIANALHLVATDSKRSSVADLNHIGSPRPECAGIHRACHRPPHPRNPLRPSSLRSRRPAFPWRTSIP